MILVLLALVGTANAVFFPLYAVHKPQCILTKAVVAGGTISASYEISGSSEEVTVYLQHPTTDAPVWQSRLLAESFKHVATAPGQYSLCFKQAAVRAKQTASFQLHVSSEMDYLEDLNSNLASKSQAEKVGILSRQVESKVNELLDHQDFAITREAVHRDTAESTNSRVLWWSIGQVAVLVALSLVQLYYVKGFFEIKLIV